MLKRIYIDNYKCLVNFDLSVGSINLFLGANGSGKSSVFEVLSRLRWVVTGAGKVSDIFINSELTRWQTSPVQTFELEVEKNGKTYVYKLEVEFDSEQKAHVRNERLHCNKKPLLQFRSGEVQLYSDNQQPGPKYPFDPTYSAVGSIAPRKDNLLLTQFKEEVEHFVIVQIDPKFMVPISQQEDRYPKVWLDNFVSWYRYLSQDQGFAYQLTDELRKVLPGFESFKFSEAGVQTRSLELNFRSEQGVTKGYGFGELSDGQKVLIVLYTLIHAAHTKGYILFLDEPENYLALPEIRPWLVNLFDLCNEDAVQAVLISHHPELIDYLLASPIGYWFERANNLTARVRPIQAESDGGLSISELITRGWLHE